MTLPFCSFCSNNVAAVYINSFILKSRVKTRFGRLEYHYLTFSGSFIKVGRSKDATRNTSGSAVQMTGLEPVNVTEDKHVLPYFLYSARNKLFNYSNPARGLHYTHAKISHNNLLSFPWTGRWVQRHDPHSRRGVKSGSLSPGNSFVKTRHQPRSMASNNK